ncbi:aminotransferase [Sphingosinicella sp. LHD-64]|uniref:aminotransferase n=1 Tax=Sphingosinicella sp. LHD-64 TaxID=3072139 RepID=UPI00280D0F53|nr:aminotransferase [Sphingosinicella sp. LHD-64]MDQ8754719.1 aminotransferase [Sphingosinicella sp. LHD-64]
MHPLFADMPTTIFEHMSGLARELGAINLGQGFPDFGWPGDVIGRAADALRAGSNQYPPMRGLAALREAVASHYRRHQDLDVTPDQVVVTSGATEALAASILALVEPGDEVVLIQPLYDAYLPLVQRAGGVPRLVRLTPPDWRIAEEALATAFTERTRLVILNNPHNPTARMFGEDELALLAEACVRADAVALTDEVWEHVAFDGRRHVPLASLPGMAERTVKVGSAGKIFSLTGWKVGWAAAPPPLIDAVARAHQFVTFTTAPNLQEAVAYGLGKDEAYFSAMRAGFAAGRDRLRDGLETAGFAPLPAQGTYFMTIDLAASGIGADDVTFCERAVREAGVAAIPLSVFYAEDPVTNVVRLCFAKTDDVLDEGLSRLRKARALFA